MGENEGEIRELGPDDFPSGSIVQINGTNKQLRVLGYYSNTGQILCTDKLDPKSVQTANEEIHLAAELTIIKKF